jgi:hypothetical protein
MNIYVSYVYGRITLIFITTFVFYFLGMSRKTLYSLLRCFLKLFLGGKGGGGGRGEK